DLAPRGAFGAGRGGRRNAGRLLVAEDLMVQPLRNGQADLAMRTDGAFADRSGRGAERPAAGGAVKSNVLRREVRSHRRRLYHEVDFDDGASHRRACDGGGDTLNLWRAARNSTTGFSHYGRTVVLHARQ